MSLIINFFQFFDDSDGKNSINAGKIGAMVCPDALTKKIQERII